MTLALSEVKMWTWPQRGKRHVRDGVCFYGRCGAGDGECLPFLHPSRLMNMEPIVWGSHVHLRGCLCPTDSGEKPGISLPLWPLSAKAPPAACSRLRLADAC